MTGPGEVNALAQYLRDVVAWQAGAGPQPAAYQPSPEAVVQGEERVKLEERLKGRRAGALARRTAGSLPPELRRRMVTARAQGRPITPEQARIAEVIRAGGRLMPEQKMLGFDPAGQTMDIAAM